MPASPLARDGAPAGSDTAAGAASEAAAELLLREVFDASRVAMVVTDQEGRYARVNSAFCSLIGRAAEDLIGLSYLEVTAPDDRERDAAMIASLKLSGSLFVRNKRYLRQDGAVVHARVQSLVTRDREGRPLMALGIIEDISELVATEAARRQAETRLQLALEAAGQGVFEWTAGDAVLTLDAMALRLVGLDAGQQRLPVDQIAASLHPEDRVAFEARIGELTHFGRDDFDLQCRWSKSPRPDWAWLRLKGRVVERGAGGAPTRILGVVNDLTEVKLVESAWQASQASYQQLFATSMDGILLSYPDDGSVLAVNPAACAILGLSEDEMRLRGNTGMLDADDPRTWQLLELRKAQGQVRGEVHLLRANGQAFEGEVTSSLYQSGGRTVAATVFREITERKRTEAELQQLNATLDARVQARTAELAQRNEELALAQARSEAANRDLQAALADLRLAQDELVRAEKMSSLGSLVAGVAHELNTPIGNAVMVASTLAGRQREFEAGMAGGLRRAALEDFLADTREVAEVLERNLQRAAEQISSFKQIAVDQSSYQRRPFELDEVVQEIGLALSPVLRRGNVQLQDAIPAGLRLDSFPGPLGQVLINLLNNAVVHAFEGRPAGVVHITAERSGPEQVRLLVCDNGCGMPAEHLKKIFDPFFTTRLGQGGSGLGLHIVYTLVTGLLGGTIEVRSTPGLGSEFRIELPMVAPRLQG